MRKKLRKIIVGDKEYFWHTYGYNGDGDGGIGLKIWKGKKLIIDKWSSESNFPESITPSYIKEQIDNKYIDSMLRIQLSDIEEQREELRCDRLRLIENAIKECDHPLDAIRELPYSPSKRIESWGHDNIISPRLVCSKCGLSEEGWGVGYKILKHGDNGGVITITEDVWRKLTLKYVPQN